MQPGDVALPDRGGGTESSSTGSPAPLPTSLRRTSIGLLLGDLSTMTDDPVGLLLAAIKDHVGDLAARAFGVVLLSTFTGRQVSRRDLVDLGLSVQNLRTAKKRLQEFGVFFEFARGTEKRADFVVRGYDLLWDTAERIQANGHFDDLRSEVLKMIETDLGPVPIPSGPFRLGEDTVNPAFVLGGNTKANTKAGASSSTGDFTGTGSPVNPAFVLGPDAFVLADGTTVSLDVVSEDVNTKAGITKRKSRLKALFVRTGERTSGSRGDRTEKEEKRGRGRKRKKKSKEKSRTKPLPGGPRKTFVGDPAEVRRLLSLRRPTGPDQKRRSDLVRVLSVRFDGVYRKAWRKKVGRRPMSARPGDFETVAIWTTLQGIDPAEFVDWVTEEYSFTGEAVASVGMIRSRKVWDRWLSKHPKKRTRKKGHAGFSYDEDPDEDDLKSRLVRAGLDGAEDLDDKTLARIERLSRATVKAGGKIPHTSKRLRPFVEWAWKNVYRKEKKK